MRTALSSDDATNFAYRLIVALKEGGIEALLPAANQSGSTRYSRQLLGALAISENIFRALMLGHNSDVWTGDAASAFQQGFQKAVVGLKQPNVATLADILISREDRDLFRVFGDPRFKALRDEDLVCQRPLADIYSILQASRNTGFAGSFARHQKAKSIDASLDSIVAETVIDCLASWVWDPNLQQSYSSATTQKLALFLYESAVVVCFGRSTLERGSSASAAREDPPRSESRSIQNRAPVLGGEIAVMGTEASNVPVRVADILWDCEADVAGLFELNHIAPKNLTVSRFTFALACMALLRYHTFRLQIGDAFGGGIPNIMEIGEQRARVLIDSIEESLFSRVSLFGFYCSDSEVISNHEEMRIWESELKILGQERLAEAKYNVAMVFRAIYAVRLQRYAAAVGRFENWPNRDFGTCINFISKELLADLMRFEIKDADDPLEGGIEGVALASGLISMKIVSCLELIKASDSADK